MRRKSWSVSDRGTRPRRRLNDADRVLLRDGSKLQPEPLALRRVLRVSSFRMHRGVPCSGDERCDYRKTLALLQWRDRGVGVQSFLNAQRCFDGVQN
jgi:hypothetical protein